MQSAAEQGGPKKKKARLAAVLTKEQTIALAVTRGFLSKRASMASSQRVGALPRIEAFNWLDLLVRSPCTLAPLGVHGHPSRRIACTAILTLRVVCVIAQKVTNLEIDLQGGGAHFIGCKSLHSLLIWQRGGSGAPLRREASLATEGGQARPGLERALPHPRLAHERYSTGFQPGSTRTGPRRRCATKDPSGRHRCAVPEAAVEGTHTWTALGHRKVPKGTTSATPYS